MVTQFWVSLLLFLVALVVALSAGMPHSHSPAAADLRRERARAKGFITASSGCATNCRVRSITRSLSFHDKHDSIAGHHSHFARIATWKAKSRISAAEFKAANLAHKEANKAKHDGTKNRFCQAWADAEDSFDEDPLFLHDPWAKPSKPAGISPAKCFSKDAKMFALPDVCRLEPSAAFDGGNRGYFMSGTLDAFINAQNTTIALLMQRLEADQVLSAPPGDASIALSGGAGAAHSGDSLSSEQLLFHDLPSTHSETSLSALPSSSPCVEDCLPSLHYDVSSSTPECVPDCESECADDDLQTLSGAHEAIVALEARLASLEHLSCKYFKKKDTEPLVDGIRGIFMQQISTVSDNFNSNFEQICQLITDENVRRVELESRFDSLSAEFAIVRDLRDEDDFPELADRFPVSLSSEQHIAMYRSESFDEYAKIMSNAGNSRPCKFFLKGKCKRGKFCKLSHHASSSGPQADNPKSDAHPFTIKHWIKFDDFVQHPCPSQSLDA